MKIKKTGVATSVALALAGGGVLTGGSQQAYADLIDDVHTGSAVFLHYVRNFGGNEQLGSGNTLALTYVAAGESYLNPSALASRVSNASAYGGVNNYWIPNNDEGRMAASINLYADGNNQRGSVAGSIRQLLDPMYDSPAEQLLKDFHGPTNIFGQAGIKPLNLNDGTKLALGGAAILTAAALAAGGSGSNNTPAPVPAPSPAPTPAPAPADSGNQNDAGGDSGGNNDGGSTPAGSPPASGPPSSSPAPAPSPSPAPPPAGGGDDGTGSGSDGGGI